MNIIDIDFSPKAANKVERFKINLSSNFLYAKKKSLLDLGFKKPIALRLFNNTRKILFKKILQKKISLRKAEVSKLKPRIRFFLKRRRHKERKFFRGGRRRIAPLAYRKRKYLRKKQKKKWKFRLKFNHNYLSLRIKRKNSFFSLYKKEFVKESKFLYYSKRRKQRIYKKIKKKTHKLLATKSLGVLKFAGRHKTSPLAKEILGRTAGNSIIKNNCTLIDIILKKKIGRLYKPIFKGLSRYPFIVRKIRVKTIHAHGFIRPRKKKRK